jgi:outer membrane immunogenic protein
MKKLLISSIAALGLGTPAFAADMAVKAPPPAPAPPPISWTGWYAGINAGGAWSDSDISTSSQNVQLCTVDCSGEVETATAAAQGATGVFSGRSAGFIGGGQFGYNWQFNNWVAGFEADIQGTRVKATGASTTTVLFLGGPFATTTNLSLTKEIDYLGTVRGRLGWLFSPTLLVFGTGGLAYGGVKASTNVSVVMPANFGGVDLNPSSNSSLSQTRTGWTAGGGFEWMFAPRWSAKVEYLYYDLGSVTYNGVLVDACIPSCVGAPAFFTNNVQTTTRFNGNIVRAGLNWHF